MTSPRTTADLLAECLLLLEVRRLWGEGLAGLTETALLPHVAVDDPDLACLLADADGRVGGTYGAALVPGGVLHLSSKPGGTAYPRTVATPEELVEALAELAVRGVPNTVAIHLDLDLEAPVPDDLHARLDHAGTVVVTLDPSLADVRFAVVVGPGVVRSEHVDGLAQFARSAGVGIVNTFGAKGVFRWDSPFHFGTVGLQERDLELAGVTAADVVLVSGLDPDEVPLAALGPVVQEVEPWQLPALTAKWPDVARPAPTERPALVEDLSRIVTPMYESTDLPLRAPRAALHLSGAAPQDGVVCADASLAGFWLARTFPTGTPGSLVVTATPQPGFAASAALASRLSGVPAVAVTDELDEVTEAIVELAHSLDVGISVQAWQLDGEELTPDEHARFCETAYVTDTADVREVAVAVDDLDAIVELAGPLTAWR